MRQSAILATTEFGSEAKVVDLDLDLSQLLQKYHLLQDILNLNNKTSATTTMMEKNDNVCAIPDNVTTDKDMGVCVKDDLSASNSTSTSNSTSISTNSKSSHMLSMIV